MSLLPQPILSVHFSLPIPSYVRFCVSWCPLRVPISYFLIPTCYSNRSIRLTWASSVPIGSILSFHNHPITIVLHPRLPNVSLITVLGQGHTCVKVLLLLVAIRIVWWWFQFSDYHRTTLLHMTYVFACKAYIVYAFILHRLDHLANLNKFD